MKTIYKFKVNPSGEPILMQEGAEILSAGVQGDAIYVWARLEPTNGLDNRLFPVYGTGHRISPEHEDLPLINTVFMPAQGLVFHVFDGGVAL